KRHTGPGGDEGVRGLGRTFLGTVDDRDGAAVYLLHPHQAVLGQAEFAGEPATVRRDGLRVVAHVVTQVERVERWLRPSTRPRGHHPPNAHSRQPLRHRYRYWCLRA